MLKQISLRIPKALIEEAIKLGKFEHLEKSLILRQALQRGIEELKEETAIELYKKEKLSISEAAKLAGIGVGEFMDLLVKSGVKSALTIEEFKREQKIALDLV